MRLAYLATVRLRQEGEFFPTEQEIAKKMLEIVDRIKNIGKKKIRLAIK